VTQIFASSVNSDLKLLGSLIQVGQPLGVFWISRPPACSRFGERR
jgi:hypothetical protein